MGVQVCIVMGSASDLEIMKEASAVLVRFGVSSEMSVISAHRTPEDLLDYVRDALKKGTKIFIAGAGGAAHLPGVIAGLSHLPVIGVPIKSANSLEGLDSILSILQMPKGVPVATVALNNSHNAGLLAVQILALADPALEKQLLAYKEELKVSVREQNRKIKAQ